MRALSCEAVEAALLERTPDVDGALAAHRDGCDACADFAGALAVLEGLAGSAGPVPSPDLVERTTRVAVAEARDLRAERRRAVRRAGLKAALAFLVSLPFLAVFQGAVVFAGRELLPRILPEGALLYVEILWALYVLAALSAVTFTLTLVAGAAARPPRPDALVASSDAPGEPALVGTC